MCMSLCCVRGVFIQLCWCLMTSNAAISFCTGAALLKRKDTVEHGFIHVLCLWGLTGPDTDHNLNKPGGSHGFQCVFSLIFFKWPSIFYITQFSTASITVQSTHFPAKSILCCEVPAGLCGCFCSSPLPALGILCFKSSSFSKPFKLCQSMTVFLAWTKKGLGLCVWRDTR